MLHDIETEQSVISGIYKHGQDAYIDVADILSNETFYDQTNQILYQCFSSALKKSEKLDYPLLLSVANQLGLDSFLQKEDEKIRKIFEKHILLENVRVLAKRVAKLHVGRQGQGLLRDAMSKMAEVTGDENTTQILSIAEKPGYDLQKILNSENLEGGLIGKGVSDLVEKLIANPNREIGISTGLKEYDRAIGGLRRKGFGLIGARRKIGKTALAANISMYVAKKLKIPVLYLDTEMDAEQHQYRLLANLTGIPITTIETSSFTGNKLFVNQIRAAAKELETIPISHEVISGKSFDEVLAIARRWTVKEVGYHQSGKLNNCLIVYDYLKLMDPSSLKHMKEYEALFYAATGLHNFCIEMDLPCLAFVQLNRELDIAQSDRLSWLATSVCTFLEKTPDEMIEDGYEYGNRKIVFDVSRFGEGLDKDNHINVQFDGNFCRMTELCTAMEMKSEKRIGACGFKTKENIEDDLDGNLF